MTTFGRERGRLALILALGALLYLPSVWTRDLWNPDEPRYAEATRTMVSTGNFILPRLNGKAYYEKPPLFFWLSAAAGEVPGIPPGSGGRLVSAAASTGTMILTWRIGAMIMGEATGALGAVLLSTLILFWNVGQTGVIDPLLTFLCTLAVYSYTRHMMGRRGGILLFYVASGFGVLAKGPVAFLLPALAIVAFTLLHRGAGALRASHPLWGVPIVILPVSVWILAGALSGGGREFIETMIIRQNLGRAVDAFIHKEPFYYLVLILPVVLLPWSIFLPQALAATFKEKVCGVRPLLLPFAWFVTTLLFFSLISSKKTRYLMPLCPPAALLVAGWMMRRLMEGSGRLREGRGALLILSGIGLASASGIGWFALRGPGSLPSSLMAPLQAPGSEAALAAVTRALGFPSSLVFLLPAILLGAASLGAGILTGSRRGEALAVILTGWIILLASGSILWTPVVNELKSARWLAERIRPEMDRGPVYYVESIHEGALNFYLRKDQIPVIDGPSEARRALAEPGARFIGSIDDLDRAGRRAGTGFEPEVCRRVGSRVLCLATASNDR